MEKKNSPDVVSVGAGGDVLSRGRHFNPSPNKNLVPATQPTFANTLFLVSCVRAKAHHPLPAKDLYISEWFTLVRRIVEFLGAPWFILSAKHGLLAPDEIIETYNVLLKTKQRRVWSKILIAQMEDVLPNATGVVLLAGIRYREFILPYLKDRYGEVLIPLKGLGYQQQVNWLRGVVRKLVGPHEV